MSWLIPEEQNDRRPKVVLGYEWIIYFVLIGPLFVAMILALFSPWIQWLRDVAR